MRRHKSPPIKDPDDKLTPANLAGLTTDELLAALRDQGPDGLVAEERTAILEELRERTARGEGPSAQALAEADGTIALDVDRDTVARQVDRTLAPGAPLAAPIEAVPEPEPTAEPDPLTAAGFMALRSQVMGGASAIESVSPELLDRLLKFAEDSRRRAKLRGAGRQQLDAVDADVEVLSALIRFRGELKRIGENAAARAAIVGPAR